MKVSQTFFRKGTIWNLRLSSRADKRLVEQQQARVAENRPADGNPLFLPAGEMLYAAIQQVTDLQDFHHVIEGDLAVSGRTSPVAVEEVALHAQMREETGALEDHAHTPTFRTDVQPRAAVEEGLSVKNDGALIRPAQSRDETDQGRFAAARRAEDADSLSPDREVHIEEKTAETLLQRHAKLHPQSLLTMRLPSHSWKTSTTTEMTMETAQRLSAMTSPFGELAYS